MKERHRGWWFSPTVIFMQADGDIPGEKARWNTPAKQKPTFLAPCILPRHLRSSLFKTSRWAGSYCTPALSQQGMQGLESKKGRHVWENLGQAESPCTPKHNISRVQWLECRENTMREKVGVSWLWYSLKRFKQSIGNKKDQESAIQPPPPTPKGILGD
jgi:hypothetical protein